MNHEKNNRRDASSVSENYAGQLNDDAHDVQATLLCPENMPVNFQQNLGNL